MKARDLAAKALDATHFCGECGPRTYQARQTLAAWLDGAIRMRTSTVRAYCGLLEATARREAT